MTEKDLNRFRGQFLKPAKPPQKSKQKRDTAGVVQGHIHQSYRHRGSYSEFQ